MTPRIRRATALPGFHLHLRLTDGSVLVKDISRFVAKTRGHLRRMRDPEFFERVRVVGGVPTWPGRTGLYTGLDVVDLDPCGLLGIDLHHRARTKKARMLGRRAAFVEVLQTYKVMLLVNAATHRELGIFGDRRYRSTLAEWRDAVRLARARGLDVGPRSTCPSPRAAVLAVLVGHLRGADYPHARREIFRLAYKAAVTLGMLDDDLRPARVPAGALRAAEGTRRELGELLRGELARRPADSGLALVRFRFPLGELQRALGISSVFARRRAAR